jgi:4Fe-4S binding domain
MLSKVPERIMHYVRWTLVISWLILIISLFYDPISHHWTHPDHLLSPFHDDRLTLPCIEAQGKCLEQSPYPVSTRIFWGMVIPSAIFVVFVAGHETWRRICPLYFFSQIPRALGLQPRLTIQNNSWLTRNHLYLQFSLFFIGLTCRLLFINSARPVLGIFLIFTILSAILVVFLYGGRSWCHYVCPFGIVQTVFTGPRGLLDSTAHTTVSLSLTQSMCRVVDRQTGMEKSACINCKSSCMDIDSEKTYWSELTKPGRRLVQYGYLGLVIGYFAYYYLYAGNFSYYFSGAWSHESSQLAAVFKPGFYLFNQVIPIPKILAVPLTLGIFVSLSSVICTKLETSYASFLRHQNSLINREQILHRVFTLCTFIAFNSFYIYGGRPEILRFPLAIQLLFQTMIVLVSTLWLTRTWHRSADQYMRESLLDKLRRQLEKLPINFSLLLGGRSLTQLTPNEVYVLAKTLPGVTQNDRSQVYKSILLDAFMAGHLNVSSSLAILQQIRQSLGISEEDHYVILGEICSDRDHFHLFYPQHQQSLHIARTLHRDPKLSDTPNQRTQIRE